MANTFLTKEDHEAFALILLVTANLGVAAQIIRTLCQMNSASRHGSLPIVIIPAYYDGSILLDMMGDFDYLITDRHVRRQDVSTGLFAPAVLDNLLWDARRHSLNAIGNFLPVAQGKLLENQQAEAIAKAALRSLRSRKRWPCAA